MNFHFLDIDRLFSRIMLRVGDNNNPFRINTVGEIAKLKQ